MPDTAIGQALATTDADGDNVSFSLGGTDAASFDIGEETGQLMTKARLDHETKSSYTVEVMADDNSGADNATATITVTIRVMDLDEEAVISAGGLSVRGSRTISYAENRTDAVATYTAEGADAVGARWSLSGDDNLDFRISSGGVLTFKATPNYEAAVDADGDNVYEVTVIATGAEGTASKDLTVTVTDVQEGTNAAPEFVDGATATRTVPENTAAGQAIGALVTATDPENDRITYRISGTDAASFRISASTGQLMTSAALDYEGARRSYTVVVTATDAGGQSDTITVTINVTDVALSAIGEQFDADNDEGIDIDELREAVRAFLPPSSSITRSDLVALVRLFLP